MHCCCYARTADGYALLFHCLQMGPSGSGKTTLLVSPARQSAWHCRACCDRQARALYIHTDHSMLLSWTGIIRSMSSKYLLWLVCL